MTISSTLPEIVQSSPLDAERFRDGLSDALDLFEQDGTPAMAGLGRERARDFRADFRRLHARLERTPSALGDEKAWLQGISGDLTVLATRFHDAQERLPARDSKVRAAAGWLDAAAALVADRQREVQAFEKAPYDVRAAREARAERIQSALEQFVDGTELDFLFDKERHLFAIGYNVTEGRRDSTFYDALASEARLASFLAIAMRHVSQEHWFKLGRLMTPVGRHRALVSWSASMFEYLMPLLVMRTYAHTLLDETYEAVVSRHIEYARSLGVPWGISESAYNLQDTGANYQYRAFGVPGIGLKRGLADDLVIAPYASILAAAIKPKDVLENLSYLESEGALGPMGFYEAIDYTKDRLEPGERKAIVKTYMAHHHGMSLVALNNCVNANVMQSRFHADPRVQASELLLQERSPHSCRSIARPKHKIEDVCGGCLVCAHHAAHRDAARHLLSNSSMNVMPANAGRIHAVEDIALPAGEKIDLDGWAASATSATSRAESSS
jgi:hypothetical protein